jgi:nicotinamide-nucleotide amidase
MTDVPDELRDLAAAIVADAKAQGRKITVAESCTGGMVCAAITAIPGSSAVFEAGYVSYGNDAKIAMLGIDSNVIDTFGAVSIATAWAMAQGALEKSGADVAVAITGVAGPDGGSPQKPVGTVVFARAERGANPNDVIADLRQFPDEGRAAVRYQAAKCALELLFGKTGP